MQQFLDEWYYRIIHSSLGRKMNRKQILLVLTNVLVLNGVQMSTYDIERITAMDEHFMIRWIVAQMPYEMKQNFDYLAMQLQMVVTMVTRARTALENNCPDEVKTVIEDLDHVGVGQAILKQAVVFATKDVGECHRLFESWTANTEQRIDRMLAGAQMAERCTQQIISVEMQLEALGVSTKSKGKSMLMGLASNNDKQLLKSVINGWITVNMQTRNESEIRGRLEKQIQEKENLLFSYKTNSLANLRASFARSGEEGKRDLLVMALEAWKSGVKHIKTEAIERVEIDAIHARLKAGKDSMSVNAKGICARMSGNGDATMLVLAWTAWTSVIAREKKDRVREAEMKKAEEAFKNLMAENKENMKVFMNKMAAGTDSGLLTQCMEGWYGYVVGDKAVRAMEKELATKASLLKSMNERLKRSVMGAQMRANDMAKHILLLQCVSNWYMESKVTHTERHYTSKVDGKRRQLESVKSLFKSFAKQIEEGLGNFDRDGDSSGTRYAPAKPSKKSSAAGMRKGAPNTTSLPDIHAVHA